MKEKLKKALLIVMTGFACSSCQKPFELSKEKIEYLTYSSESNFKIDFAHPILSGDYEDWKREQYEILQDDTTKGIKPYVIVNFGSDSIKVSLLALTESLMRESHKDRYEIEWVVASDGRVKFMPSIYFDSSENQLFSNDLRETVKNRYTYSDSLNLKCPEWWIIGNERNDMIESRIFEEILAGYVDFTRSKFLSTYRTGQFEKLLQEHKKRFPLRVSIEEPLCRYGYDE